MLTDSSVFKDMLQHPDPSMTPIDLDLAGHPLTALLDSFSGSVIHLDPINLKATDTYAILEFVDKFDFAALKEVVDDRLSSQLFQPEAWFDILVVASNDHHLSIAPVLLRRLNEYTFKGKEVWQHVKNIEPRWLKAILEGVFGTCHLEDLAPEGGDLTEHVLYRKNAIPKWGLTQGTIAWITNFDPYKDEPLT